MKKQPARIYYLIIGLTIFGLLMTACGGAIQEKQSITSTPSNSEGPAESQLSTIPSQIPETQETDPDPANQVMVPNVEVAPNPTEPLVVKTNLEATDPATVALATGKPHLVEFFAFW